MTYKLNEYAGADDWRWLAIERAKAELVSAAELIEQLDRRLVRKSSQVKTKAALRHVKNALRRLRGE